jgi:biopolymer transport protein ExbD
MIGRRAMSFRPGRGREEPEINFIPLIDLLLVILIFLMVTTTYSKFTELQVNLPSAEADSAAGRPAEIVVVVAADGRYLLDAGQAPQVVAPEALGAELVRVAASQREPLLVIHADAGARHQSVVAVLEAARQAGIARVSFAAQSGAAGAGAR